MELLTAEQTAKNIGITVKDFLYKFKFGEYRDLPHAIQNGVHLFDRKITIKYLERKFNSVEALEKLHHPNIN